MSPLFQRHYPILIVAGVTLILGALRLVEYFWGVAFLLPFGMHLVVILTMIVYLVATVLKSTEEEAHRLLESAHRFPSVLNTPTPRGVSNSNLIQNYIVSMRTQHLILVADQDDLQRITKLKAGLLGHAHVRVVYAAPYRNAILGMNRADHIVLVTKEKPEFLYGLVFASIEVSPALEGLRAPDWVATLMKDNEGKLAGTLCSYPQCNCPADHPGNHHDWCFRNLPTRS